MEQWHFIKPGVILSPDKDRILINLKNPEYVKAVIPPTWYKSVDIGGVEVLSLPYDEDVVRLLKNVGVDTFGIDPLLHRYDRPKVEGKHPLMAHQVITSAFFVLHERAFCTTTMRMGKTASAIVAADYLQKKKGAGAFLVVATLTNMRGAWLKEIKGLLPKATAVVIHAGGVEKRKKLLQQPADFYIINYDGAKQLECELHEMVQCGQITGVILDESTHFGNTKSANWEAMNHIVNGVQTIKRQNKVMMPDGTEVDGKVRRRRTSTGVQAKYVWALTGTPGDPMKVYGQVKLLKPNAVPEYITQWEDQNYYKYGFRRVLKEGASDNVFRVMQPCIRFDKKDILDLPPVQITGRESEMSKEQTALYKAVKKDMTMCYGSSTITAVNKAAMVNKLLQISGGCVRTDEGEILSLDITKRLDVVEEIINSTERKFIIFAIHTAVIERLVKELCNRGYPTEAVHGGVSSKARDDIFHRFQYSDNNNIRGVVCHPRTTAFGVELAAADTMIFYGPPITGDFIYQQAIERMSSMKQTSDSLLIAHITSNAEERRLFADIADGVSTNEAINDLFTTKLEE